MFQSETKIVAKINYGIIVKTNVSSIEVSANSNMEKESCDFKSVD